MHESAQCQAGWGRCSDALDAPAHAPAAAGAAVPALFWNEGESSQDPGRAALSRLEAEDMETEEA